MNIVLLYGVPVLIAAAAVAYALRRGENMRRSEAKAGKAPETTIGKSARMGLLLIVSAIVGGATFGLAHFSLDRLVMHFFGTEVQATVTWLTDTNLRSKRAGSFGTENFVAVETDLEYEIDGVRHKVRTSCHDNPPLKIGDPMPLKVNRFDPMDYLVLRGTRDQTLVQYQPLIMGCICVALVAFVVWLGSGAVFLIPPSDLSVPSN